MYHGQSENGEPMVREFAFCLLFNYAHICTRHLKETVLWGNIQARKVYNTFCFPSVGHVVILLRTISFKLFGLIHVHIYA